MAKRGRKPSTEKKQKGYFYEVQEAAVLQYLGTDDTAEKNRIYNEILRPAFDKMIESIIRRYNLYVPDETFEDTFNDTASFLLTKASKFKDTVYFYKEAKEDEGQFVEVEPIFFKGDIDENYPQYVKIFKYDVIEHDEELDSDIYSETDGKWYYYKKCSKKQKAYSYYGTICKNYLIGKIQNHKKLSIRNPSYDESAEEFVNSIRYSDVEDKSAQIAAETVSHLVKRLGEMVDNPQANDLKENEVKLGKALKRLLENWEYVLTTDGSNKLNKAAILLYLRENTGLDTKGIRDNMKKFKKEFLIIKDAVIN
jgi:hypothetical protein